MVYYYAATLSKAHALHLDQKLKAAGIQCELSYIPRPVSAGVCNMGVKFSQHHFKDAIETIKASGLPGCKVYMEQINENNCSYFEVKI